MVSLQDFYEQSTPRDFPQKLRRSVWLGTGLKEAFEKIAFFVVLAGFSLMLLLVVCQALYALFTGDYSQFETAEIGVGWVLAICSFWVAIILVCDNWDFSSGSLRADSSQNRDGDRRRGSQDEIG